MVVNKKAAGVPRAARGGVNFFMMRSKLGVKLPIKRFDSRTSVRTDVIGRKYCIIIWSCCRTLNTLNTLQLRILTSARRPDAWRTAIDRKSGRLFRGAMNHKAKVLVTGLLLALALTAHSELVWEQTELELRPAIDDETAVGHFKYQNKGDKPVAIKNVSTSCGCTVASTNKNGVAPGEKGEITATFQIGNRVGVQEKMIAVTTDDPAHPSAMLKLKVTIPQVLDIQPVFVFWQADEAAKPKAIIATAGKDVAIKNLEVSSSDPNFVTKVEQGSSAGEFRINVEPRQTIQAATAALTIKPTPPVGKSMIFLATARVMAQPPAVAQQTNAAAKPAKPPGKIDACALLTSKEIESVQGESLQGTKPGGDAAGYFAFSQCNFILPTSGNSIGLAVMQRQEGPAAPEPKQYWKETFHGDKDKEKGRGEEESKSVAPENVTDVGDEAFWVENLAGGQLYVLKGDSYIVIRVGGAGDRASKIKKSKDLAQMVLKRL